MAKSPLSFAIGTLVRTPKDTMGLIIEAIIKERRIQYTVVVGTDEFLALHDELVFLSPPTPQLLSEVFGSGPKVKLLVQYTEPDDEEDDESEFDDDDPEPEPVLNMTAHKTIQLLSDTYTLSPPAKEVDKKLGVESVTYGLIYGDWRFGFITQRIARDPKTKKLIETFSWIFTGCHQENREGPKAASSLSAATTSLTRALIAHRKTLPSYLKSRAEAKARIEAKAQAKVEK